MAVFISARSLHSVPARRPLQTPPDTAAPRARQRAPLALAAADPPPAAPTSLHPPPPPRGTAATTTTTTCGHCTSTTTSPYGQLNSLEVSWRCLAARRRPDGPPALSRRLPLDSFPRAARHGSRFPPWKFHPSWPPQSGSQSQCSPRPPNPLDWSRHHHPRSSVASILVPLPLSHSLRLGPSLYNPPLSDLSLRATPPDEFLVSSGDLFVRSLRYPPLCLPACLARGSGVSLFFLLSFWAIFALSLLDDGDCCSLARIALRHHRHLAGEFFSLLPSAR